MLRGSSPGLRAAIGFLRVFGLFALLCYLAGIALCVGCCLMAVDVSGGAREGIMHVGIVLGVITGMSGAFVLRSGALMMVAIFEDGYFGLLASDEERVAKWAWGVASFAVGISAGVFTVQGVLACWLLIEDSRDDARVVIAVVSLVLALVGWVFLPWVWRNQR